MKGQVKSRDSHSVNRASQASEGRRRSIYTVLSSKSSPSRTKNSFHSIISEFEDVLLTSPKEHFKSILQKRKFVMNDDHDTKFRGKHAEVLIAKRMRTSVKPNTNTTNAMCSHEMKIEQQQQQQHQQQALNQLQRSHKGIAEYSADYIIQETVHVDRKTSNDEQNASKNQLETSNIIHNNEKTSKSQDDSLSMQTEPSDIPNGALSESQFYVQSDNPTSITSLISLPSSKTSICQQSSDNNNNNNNNNNNDNENNNNNDDNENRNGDTNHHNTSQIFSPATNSCNDSHQNISNNQRHTNSDEKSQINCKNNDTLDADDSDKNDSENAITPVSQMRTSELDSLSSMQKPTSPYLMSPHVALKCQRISMPNNINDKSYRELIIYKCLSQLKQRGLCPNFIQIYDWFKSKDNHIEESISAMDENPQEITSISKLQYMNYVLEKADMTLQEYIGSRLYVSLAKYKNILFQILFALHIAQREFEFTHNDLHLKNILVKKLPKEKDGFFLSHEGTYFRIKTNAIIKITDFGLSRIKLPSGLVICSKSTIANNGVFLPSKDIDQIREGFTRIQVNWNAKDIEQQGLKYNEQKQMLLDLRKKMKSVDICPHVLLHHPFFNSLVVEPMHDAKGNMIREDRYSYYGDFQQPEMDIATPGDVKCSKEDQLFDAIVSAHNQKPPISGSSRLESLKDQCNSSGLQETLDCLIQSLSQSSDDVSQKENADPQQESHSRNKKGRKRVVSRKKPQDSHDSENCSLRENTTIPTSRTGNTPRRRRRRISLSNNTP